MMVRWKRLFDGVTFCCQASGALVLAFMAVSIAYDALMRYLFAMPTSWSLEANSFLLVYLALMTAAHTQSENGQISISVFVSKAGPTGRRILKIMIGLAGAGFSGIIAWRGFYMTVDAYTYGERVSSGLGTPMWLPYGILPISFGLLAIQFIIGMFEQEAATEDASIL